VDEVTLIPFSRELLPAVRRWFEHPVVRSRLGGPEWPDREISLLDSGIGEVFRGRRVLRTHSWVALNEIGEPVAKIGGDVYDRWCRYTETPAGAIVEDVEPGPAMGLAYVVDPKRWRHGFGVASLRAAVMAPEVADVVLFAAGIEPDNTASIRCATAAGFMAETTESDWEGIVHFVLRRSAIV
jgi:RimJ/RimL family protein N-acetyltransferase